MLSSFAAACLDGLALESKTIADFIQTCATVACGGESGIPDDAEGLIKHVSVGPRAKIRLRVEFGGRLGARRPGCVDAVEFHPKPMKVMKVGDSFIKATLVATSYLVGIGIGRHSALVKLLVEFLKCRGLGEYLQVMFGAWNIGVSVMQRVDDSRERYFPPSG